MSASRWSAVKSLFHLAVEAEGEERRALLARAAAADPALRGEVESLLAADAHRTPTPLREVLATSAGAAPDPAPPLPEAGRLLGPYRLLREIGCGGMGTVFLAERADGLFAQRVAIKLLRPGFGGAEMLRRFHQEREILAGLSHPNIARLLDGGTAGDGSPYVVLEYVDGLAVDEYCRRHDLDLEKRLHLFQQVCQAVHHAHQRLVVHRDLKPSNILVTRAGIPKLLDFGIAKPLGPTAAGRACPPTEPRWKLMTTAYASPEQARGEALTTATDVYSLGVVLHELLAGRRPFEEDGSSPAEARRREEARPRRLPRELEAIVAVALRRDPGERYASAEQLAEDLARFLSHRPVRARRPTALGRALLLARRNPLAGALAAVLAALGVAMTVQAIDLRRALDRTRAEQARADGERRRAASVSEFLVDLFRVADPEAGGGGQVAAREILDAATRRLAVELAGQPELRARLLDTAGVAYQNLGLLDEAEARLSEALGIRRRLRGDAHPELAESLAHLSFLRHAQGRAAEAESLARDGLALARRHFGEAHPEVAMALHGLGEVLHAKGDYQGAEALYRQALTLRRSLLPPEHPAVAESLAELGLVLCDRGRPEAAEPLLRQALALWRRAEGPEHRRVASTLGHLAFALRGQGDLAGAEAHLASALAMQERILGGEHPDVARTLLDLGNVRFELGDLGAAERHLRRALDLHRRLARGRHPMLGTNLNDLGLVLQAAGDLAAAEALFEQALEVYRTTLSPEHPAPATVLTNLARVARTRGDFGTAERRFRQALALRRRLLAPGHRDTAFALFELGRLLNERGASAEAAPLLEEALGSLGNALPPGDLWIANAQSELGAALAALGRPAEAGPLLRTSWAALAAAGPAWSAPAERARRRLAQLGAGS